VRPVYECNKDIWNEHAVAQAIECWSGAQVRRTPKMYPLDFALVRNHEVVALAECKVRKNPRDQYPTYMLSAHKFVNARNFSKRLGLPALLFVRWSCGSLGYIDLSEPHERIGIGGRTDRGDAQDIEPVVHWKIEKFRRVGIEQKVA
jgi:hypothetical protein